MAKIVNKLTSERSALKFFSNVRHNTHGSPLNLVAQPEISSKFSSKLSYDPGNRIR